MTSDHSQSFATHVPGFDEVLGGGLRTGGLYLLMGSSGTGKTILASQLAFRVAREQNPVVVVTLLSESHGKLIEHLKNFTFFDAALVGNRITFLNGYDSLRSRGVDGLLEMLTSLMTQQQARLLVIEGFSSLRTMDTPQIEVAHFIHRLNALVTTLRCTAIAVDPSLPTNRTEESLVDGVIELSVHVEGARLEREIQAHKLRAANPLLGKHALRINDDGVHVYPRLEGALSRRTRAGQETRERSAYGIAGLDDMMQGGPYRPATTCVFGPPGSGKTLLGLHYLNQGLKQNEKVLHFGFYESPARLLEKAGRVGLDLKSAAAGGKLKILWQPPLEFLLDELAYKLLDEVRRERPRRLLIDGLDGFVQAAVRKERFGLFITALTAELRALDIDVVLTRETQLAHWNDLNFPVSTALIENILILRYGELRSRLHRLISILKLRGSEYDPTVRRLEISNEGMGVVGEFHGAEDILMNSGVRTEPKA
jgi:circadian clock protein KaiC